MVCRMGCWMVGWMPPANTTTACFAGPPASRRRALPDRSPAAESVLHAVQAPRLHVILVRPEASPYPPASGTPAAVPELPAGAELAEARGRAIGFLSQVGMRRVAGAGSQGRDMRGRGTGQG